MSMPGSEIASWAVAWQTAHQNALLARIASEIQVVNDGLLWLCIVATMMLIFKRMGK